MGIRSFKKKLEQKDKKYLWHPFTQMKDWGKDTPLTITEASGSFLKDFTGRWYLDGVSSIWVNIHGHRKKEIDQAIKEQVDRISHSTLLGLTHPPAVELAEKLVKVVNSSLVSRSPASGLSNGSCAKPTGPSSFSGLTRVFYSDSGSTAVEIALKMAFQYWRHKGASEKTRFMHLGNSYHGDTLGAVSVGGIDIFHKTFAPLLFRSFKAPCPHCYRCELGKKYPSCKLACLAKMEQMMKQHHTKIAGLIIEPIVQGAGGMLVSPPGYLKGAKRLCRKYNILMIADEVATGFGRTGKMFACGHEKVSPDLLCLAKGLTGGYLPLAATIASEKIYRAFLGEFTDLKTFFHGHTYTGNQLACAAGIANLKLFKKERTLARMRGKTALLKKELLKISDLPHVGEVRQKGFMVGIELVRDRKTKQRYPLKKRMGWQVCNRAREKGLIIRPLGDVVILMPPLSISSQELKRLVQITSESIDEITG